LKGTRTNKNVFHQSVQSSFAKSVNEMWKLCKTATELEFEPGFSSSSAEFETDC
jgi:hypothetical protein